MTMFLVFITFITLTAIVGDTIYYIRLRGRTTPLRRRLFAFFAFATDALPLLTIAFAMLLPDNSNRFMLLVMWGLWLWIATVPPRLIYYFFRLIRLPRVGFAVATCLVMLFIWGASWGRTTIRINHVEICSERIPKGFDGFRIAQFSDTHIGTLISPEAELQRIVNKINNLQPDLIVFSGDLVNIRSVELDKRAMQMLGGLRAPFGVISVLGNHDIGAYIRDTLSFPSAKSLTQLIERQREMGWQVLEDSTIYLQRGGDSITLTGISFHPELHHIRHDKDLPDMNLSATYKNMPDSLYNITVAHVPQLWSQIKATGYGDLTLSGHTHSMQMKLRLFGREFSPAQWLYTEWSGRYDDGGRTLYINDGTGYVGYPMRLGAYPEITLFTLKRCE